MSKKKPDIEKLFQDKEFLKQLKETTERVRKTEDELRKKSIVKREDLDKFFTI